MLPAWKTELLELLDFYSATQLLEQYKVGLITDEAFLYMNLGISPERLQALTPAFNTIVKQHRKHQKPIYLSVDDVGNCHKLGQLIEAVKSRVEK